MDVRVKECAREDCSKTFESFDGRKVYCSRSCAVTVNNRRKGQAKKPCLCCGTDIVAYQSNVYCSAECRRYHPIKKWLTGEWDGTVKEGLSSTIRNHLLEEAGYRCQDGRSECGGWAGVNPVSGKTVLSIDHVDGNPYNNRPENLVVICPNCHSLTPTYGALNKGNGRKFRYAGVA